MRTWKAWSGTKEELQRIAQLMSDLFGVRREELVAVYKELLELDLSMVDKDDDAWKLEREKEFSERDLRQFESSFGFTVTLTQGDDSVTGTFDDIKDEIDRRVVSAIVFSVTYPYSIGGETFKLSMKWAGYSSPVELEVSSTDIGWANQAFARLSSEIDKGRPPFGWIASGLGGPLMIGLSAYALVSIALVSIFHRVSPGEWNEVGFLIAILICLPLLLATHEKLFPAVEIVEPGAGATLPRRMAYVGGIAIAIVIGVVINILV